MVMVGWGCGLTLGKKALPGPPLQPRKRGHVGPHVAIGRCDQRCRPAHDVVAGKERFAQCKAQMTAKMADFFTGFDWWKLDPADGIADNGGLVLAEKNKRYAVYAPTGGRVNLKIPAGDWRVKVYNPRTGEWGKKTDEKADDGGLTLKFTADGDWAAVLVRD